MHIRTQATPNDAMRLLMDVDGALTVSLIDAMSSSTAAALSVHRLTVPTSTVAAQARVSPRCRPSSTTTTAAETGPLPPVQQLQSRSVLSPAVAETDFGFDLHRDYDWVDQYVDDDDDIDDDIETHDRYIYTLKTEVLKITLEVLFLTLPKSARRDNTWSVTLTPHEV